MNKDELILIKELIREVVRSTVKEVLQEEQKNSKVNKDLREVKFLLAKVIKEGYVPKSAESSLGNMSELRQKLRESIGEDFNTSISKTSSNVNPKLSMSPERAIEISVNGSLPDFDAPIPNMPKNSPIWEEMKKRIG